MRALALAVLLAGCSTSKAAEHDLHAAQQQDLAGNEHVRIDTTTRQGPETITTTVEEFGTVTAAGTGVGLENVTPPSSAVGPGVPPTDHSIIRRTIIVDQRGPVIQKTQAQAAGTTTVRTSATVEEHDKSAATMKASSGCMLGLGFYGALAIAGLCLAGGLYLKWRR